jgi:hypothetical protein
MPGPSCRSQFIPIVIVPQALLSGSSSRSPRYPDPAAHLPSDADDLRHQACQVMIKGATLGSSVVQVDLLFLAGVAVLFVVLAAGTIRREIA